jgi:predicted nuclease of predicted toxin-antitoxin system
LKLLFDEMLLPTLPGLVGDLYPGSVHVRDIDRKGQPDLSVWYYARGFDFLVTSKDKDHLELQERRGFPPIFRSQSDGLLEHSWEPTTSSGCGYYINRAVE